MTTVAENASIAAGTVLYAVKYTSIGKPQVESVTVKKTTPQLVWLEKAGFAFGYRTRIDRTEAERFARSPLEAVEKYVEMCSENVARAQTDMTHAVALLETVQ